MEPEFDIRLAVDSQGVVRVTVLGDLDIATRGILQDRLSRLGEAGFAAQLDLSALRFIDASGLAAVINSVADANIAGRSLNVDRHLSRSVARLLELTGVADYVWPPGRSEETVTRGSSVTPLSIW